MPSEKGYQIDKSSLGRYHYKIHQGMRYPLKHTKWYQTPKREDGSKQTKLSTKFHDGTKYQKEMACLPPKHTWWGSQDEHFRENRIAPPRVVHYIGFVFEYKMHKVGSPLSLYQENTRQDKENNKDTQVARKAMGVDTNLARDKANKKQTPTWRWSIISTTHKWVPIVKRQEVFGNNSRW